MPLHLPHRDTDDPFFWRSLLFSAGLATMVSVAATGGFGGLSTVMIAAALLGFGLFFLAFPRGLHIAVAQATMQAGYMCVFVFFLDANFPRALPWQAQAGFVLPVAGFLAGALVRRRAIGQLLAATHPRRPRFDHMLRWGAPVAAIGAASFAVPDIDGSAAFEGWAFLAAMAAIALVVGLAARDVVTFILDTSAVFESFFAQVAHLAVPAFAFMTFWALLAIVFACLYRIADMTTAEPLFSIGGAPKRLEFAEALYFSVVTLATVGYGDIYPVGPLARLLSVAQIVAGLLLLIFGVNELIRYAETMPKHASERHREDRAKSDHPQAIIPSPPGTKHPRS
jgi:voltage-gated potassium channel Kch